MPKPSSTIMVQIVRVAGSRSMRAEIAPAVKPAAPLSFMFPRLDRARAHASRFLSPHKDASFRPPVKYERAGSDNGGVAPLRLILLQHRAIDAPRAAAGEGDIEEYEAEKDRPLSAIGERIEGARRMRNEIGEGHFA